MIHFRGMKTPVTSGGGGANPFASATAAPYSLKTGGGDPDAGRESSERDAIGMTSGKRKRPGGKNSGKRNGGGSPFSSQSPSKAPKLSDSMGAGSRAGESAAPFASTTKRSFPQKRY